MTLTTQDAAAFIGGGAPTKHSEADMAGPKEEKKANYEVLVGFSIDDTGKSVLPGAVVELTESQARRWVGMEYVSGPVDKKVQDAPKDSNHRKLPAKPVPTRPATA